MSEPEDVTDETVPAEGEPSFCLHDFKKWMEHQGDVPSMIRRPSRQEDWKGATVMPKLENSKRLVQKISIEEGDIQAVAKDFRRNGGLVVSIDQHYLVVEVDSGRFAIPKFFVKKIS